MSDIEAGPPIVPLVETRLVTVPSLELRATLMRQPVTSRAMVLLLIRVMAHVPVPREQETFPAKSTPAKGPGPPRGPGPDAVVEPVPEVAVWVRVVVLESAGALVTPSRTMTRIATIVVATMTLPFS